MTGFSAGQSQSEVSVGIGLQFQYASSIKCCRQFRLHGSQMAVKNAHEQCVVEPACAVTSTYLIEGLFGLPPNHLVCAQLCILHHLSRECRVALLSMLARFLCCLFRRYVMETSISNATISNGTSVGSGRIFGVPFLQEYAVEFDRSRTPSRREGKRSVQ